MRGVSLLAFALLLLAGCGSAPEPSLGAPPTLDFGAMEIATVPLEPWEARGVIQATWQDGLFAVHTKGEGGMPAMAVRSGDQLYVTDAGMGWTQWSLAAYADASPRGFRYLAWDVPALLAGAQLTEADDGRFSAVASYRARGQAHEAAVDVAHAGPAVAEVRVATALDAESPYTLRPAAAAFPFAVAVPPGARPAAEVARLDGEARDAHARILALVAAYGRNHGNTLPDRLDADTLRVELLASGGSWPAGAYDGQPMRDAESSGHFRWVRCALNDGLYEGYGWDGAAVRYAFGRGCA